MNNSYTVGCPLLIQFGCDFKAFGQDAARDTYDSDEINPAAFLTSDADANTKLIMEIHAREQVGKKWVNFIGIVIR